MEQNNRIIVDDPYYKDTRTAEEIAKEREATLFWFNEVLPKPVGADGILIVMASPPNG